MDLVFVIMESNDYMTRAINIDSILKKKKTIWESTACFPLNPV